MHEANSRGLQSIIEAINSDDRLATRLFLLWAGQAGEHARVLACASKKLEGSCQHGHSDIIICCFRLLHSLFHVFPNEKLAAFVARAGGKEVTPKLPRCYNVSAKRSHVFFLSILVIVATLKTFEGVSKLESRGLYMSGS